MVPRLGVEIGAEPRYGASGKPQKRESAPSGAQVAAEAMTYDRERRTDCKAGRS